MSLEVQLMAMPILQDLHDLHFTICLAMLIYH
jgi:hypothetical protein